MAAPPNPDSFPVPACRHRREIEVRRSRFIATIDEASSRDDAKAVIQQVRERFPDAGHHCWAWILGAPDDVYGQDQSDDGEPRGTAGKPMLNVLQHSGVGRTVAIVSRYFGGTKLGAGGLVRAYGQAVNNALADMPTRLHRATEPLSVTLPYAMFDTFVHWLASTDMEIVDRQFADEVTIVVNVPASLRDERAREIETFGQGAFRLP